jgi:PIN domain nuclease of toxin-antitoxin system
MASRVYALEPLLAERGVTEVPLSAQISIHAGLLNWLHRDPFDRIIAATGQALGLPVVSADGVFDQLPGLRRVW